jgi:hypothetical protein
MTSEGTGGFCPACGAGVAEEDRFCRGCGRPLEDDPHDAATGTAPMDTNAVPAQETDGGRPSRSRRLVIAGTLLIVAIVVVAIAVIALGKSSSKVSAEITRAHAAERAYAALKSRLYGPFTVAMGQRTKFFIAEANFLNATRDANAKIKKYDGESKAVEAEDKQISNANSGLESACRAPESSVPCPNPTYPEPPTAPSVASDVATLHHAAAELSSLKAEVLSVSPQPELQGFYAQLQAAITSLATDAEANANILSEGVTEASGGSKGYIEEKKLSTIHPETGLPSVRLLNRDAVALINTLHLEIGQYDVPGGTDVNPADHSTAQ